MTTSTSPVIWQRESHAIWPSAQFRDGGWPAEVDGDAVIAPFSAPSAGPPPWHVYRFTFHTAYGVATVEPWVPLAGGSSADHHSPASGTAFVSGRTWSGDEVAPMPPAHDR